jgi:hypothetical protein
VRMDINHEFRGTDLKEHWNTAGVALALI